MELRGRGATEVKSETVFWSLLPLPKDILLPMSRVCGLNSDKEAVTHKESDEKSKKRHHVTSFGLLMKSLWLEFF